MRKKGILLIIYLLPGFITIAQTNINALSSKEKQVWQRAEALNNAVFKNKDSLALKDLLHSDVTYGHSSGVLEDKKQMISVAVTNTAVYNNISLEIITVRLVKKTAVVRHNLRATSTDKGITASLDLSIMQVWVKQKGKWQLLARQAVKGASKSL